MRRSWPTWTATSVVALGTLACTAFAQTVFAQTEKPNTPSAVTSQTGRRSYSAGSSASSYLEDPTQVKFATLLSEPAFFELVEKEIKIEEVRLEAIDARQGLLRIRNKLIVGDVQLLEIVDREVSRAFDPLESAGQSIAAVCIELHRFHESPTPQLAAIAAGKASAVPVVARVRRLIKAAERDLSNLSRGLVEGRLSPQDQLEAARDALKMRLESLPPEDRRREKIELSLAQIEAAVKAMNELDTRSKDLASQLQKIRVQFFAECPPAPGPALGPQGNAASARPPTSSDAACQNYSLDLLRNSAPALADLDEAAARHAKVVATLERIVAAKDRAVELAEQADAIANPAHGKARDLQSQAVKLIDDAEGQLAVLRRLLTQDAPGEVEVCAHCGKTFDRTRRVLDPSCVCEQSNEMMQRAEQSLQQARKLSDDMLAVLTAAEPAEAPASRKGVIDELRGDKRVLDRLSLALQRGEEFRTQQFSFYPGESYAPPSEPVPERSFAPMVAYYAARESWHYPLYFDDLSLERYGHSFGCVQPLVSYGKFLTDLALVPYNACLAPPWCTQYDLGLYRPGDDEPHLIYLPRPDLKAALFEIVVWTGLAYMP